METKLLEENDKEIVLDQILNVIFKNSPNKERNIEMMKLYYNNNETRTGLAFKYKIEERRVKTIIDTVERVDTSGYANRLSDEERWKILDLIKEYRL